MRYAESGKKLYLLPGVKTPALALVNSGFADRTDEFELIPSAHADFPFRGPIMEKRASVWNNIIKVYHSEKACSRNGIRRRPLTGGWCNGR